MYFFGIDSAYSCQQTGFMNYIMIVKHNFKLSITEKNKQQQQQIKTLSAI